MRPILCVVDLRDTSVQVLEVATRMAHAYNSHLTILFPYRLIDNDTEIEVSKLKAQLEQEAKEKFQSLIPHLPLLKKVSYEFQAEIGFPADRISWFVKRNKVGSVVIGQRQANLMDEANHLTLQSLIRNSRLPFTIIPEELDVEVLT